ESACISAAARSPGCERGAKRAAAGDARSRGSRTGTGCRAAPDLACRLGAAAADRFHGRDRPGAGVGGDAAHRVDEPAHPLATLLRLSIHTLGLGAADGQDHAGIFTLSYAGAFPL